jgi:dipeptidyl aminopeptidase/acylaminoacyl peptidase
MRRVALASIFALQAATPAWALPGPELPLAPRVTADRDLLGRWHPLGPIVFSRTAEDGSDIWIVRADGSKLERITSSRKSDTEPTWAPKGPNIMFVRTGQSGRSDLYAMNLTAGRPTLFLEDGSSPAWSPDGSRIAFVRTVEGNTDIYSVAADGSDLVRVTTDPAVDTEPTWGPGGARLTFASDRDGDFDIYSVDPDGSNVQAFTEDTIDQRNPWDFWSWRDIGYDQGPETDPVWCLQDIGVPAVIPGTPSQCSDPGIHSYAVGTWSPFSWVAVAPNGATHLWVWATKGKQATFGRRSDADPAVRPASRSVVGALTRAAGDINIGLLGAQTWVETNGSTAGADESPTGLITVASTLCLVDAAQQSVATAATCDAGAGTGSTSVYADDNELALARDTGLGFCLWANFDDFWGEREVRFGESLDPSTCTGSDARSATQSAW